MDLEQAFVVELAALTGLSGKVFPIYAQEGTAAPYCTYEQDDEENTEKLDGHDTLITARYQINCYQSTYSGLVTLYNSILAEIKTWQQTTLGASGPFIQSCTIQNALKTYDHEVKLYQGSIDIEITYKG
jgi:hypothetical protein